MQTSSMYNPLHHHAGSSMLSKEARCRNIYEEAICPTRHIHGDSYDQRSPLSEDSGVGSGSDRSPHYADTDDDEQYQHASSIDTTSRASWNQHVEASKPSKSGSPRHNHEMAMMPPLAVPHSGYHKPLSSDAYIYPDTPHHVTPQVETDIFGTPSIPGNTHRQTHHNYVPIGKPDPTYGSFHQSNRWPVTSALYVPPPYPMYHNGFLFAPPYHHPTDVWQSQLQSSGEVDLKYGTVSATPMSVPTKGYHDRSTTAAKRVRSCRQGYYSSGEGTPNTSLTRGHAVTEIPETRFCANCKTHDTALWRRSQKHKKYECNACSQYERLRKTPRPMCLWNKPIKRRKRKSRS